MVLSTATQNINREVIMRSVIVAASVSLLGLASRVEAQFLRTTCR